MDLSFSNYKLKVYESGAVYLINKDRPTKSAADELFVCHNSKELGLKTGEKHVTLIIK